MSSGYPDERNVGRIKDCVQKGGPMNWFAAILENELAEGARQVVKVGGHAILLTHHDGRIYATASACPHMRLPLKGGKIGGYTIVCPWHQSAFDLETGDVKEWSPWPPAVGRMLGALSREKALPVFPTKVEDGRIWVVIEQKCAT
jgi:nitrite reductase/ring-hydroxylating ferredoxin subunit